MYISKCAEHGRLLEIKRVTVMTEFRKMVGDILLHIFNFVGIGLDNIPCIKYVPQFYFIFYVDIYKYQIEKCDITIIQNCDKHHVPTTYDFFLNIIQGAPHNNRHRTGTCRGVQNITI